MHHIITKLKKSIPLDTQEYQENIIKFQKLFHGV